MTSPTRTPGGAPLRPDLEWRYLRHPRTNEPPTVVHALQTNLLATSGRSHAAVCGVAPAFGADWWYGAGTQAEYDTAAQLRPCQRCLRGLGLAQRPTRKGPQP